MVISRKRIFICFWMENILFSLILSLSKLGKHFLFLLSSPTRPSLPLSTKSSKSSFLHGKWINLVPSWSLVQVEAWLRFDFPFSTSHEAHPISFSSSPIFHETSSSHGKFPNLFPYDHLSLRKYGLCLISSIPLLEEVIGN